MDSPSQSLDEKNIHSKAHRIDGSEDDAANEFLRQNEVGTVSDLYETPGLRRKIDLRIMPILMTIYFLQYLDKTLLNYAAVMGIRSFLKGNEYANLGTMFYVGYIVAEPIQCWLMQKFPIGKFIGVNVMCWGVLVAATAGAKSYGALLTIRILLGAFEASVAPSLILITGMWWTKAEQSRRTGLWYMQIGVAQIVGAGMSYGFQHVKSTKLANWQILFLFMGILTCIVGALTFAFLPDSPMTAKFLTDQEKVAAIEHVRVNQTGVENKTFKWYQVKELLFKDKETWPLFFIVLLAMIDNGAVSNFSSVIIKTFGYSDARTTIIQMPSGAVSIICTFVATYLVGAIGHRSFMICLVCLPTVLGVGLLLGLDSHHKVGKLFGVYLLNACPAMLPMIYSWNSANTSGYTKRTMRNALTLMAFCVGNIIGPQLFQVKDGPNYTPAKIVLMVSVAAVIVFQLMLRQLMIAENKKRDRDCGGVPATFEINDKTDIENWREFRYVY